MYSSSRACRSSSRVPRFTKPTYTLACLQHKRESKAPRLSSRALRSRLSSKPLHSVAHQWMLESHIQLKTPRVCLPGCMTHAAESLTNRSQVSVMQSRWVSTTDAGIKCHLILPVPVLLYMKFFENYHRRRVNMFCNVFAVWVVCAPPAHMRKQTKSSNLVELGILLKICT